MQACTQQAKRRRPAAKQAKKRGRNARFKLLPCRAKGAAPVRKDGRAATGIHLPPKRQRQPPRPDVFASKAAQLFKNCRQSQRTGTHSVECWPALRESGKEDFKPCGFPACHASQRQAKRRRPRREAGEKTRTKRSIQTPSTPSQRDAPVRKDGRAATGIHLPPKRQRQPPRPDVFASKAAQLFKNCRQSQRTGTHSVECWPALRESGKEDFKPRGFPACHASQRQAQRCRSLAAKQRHTCPHAASKATPHMLRSRRQNRDRNARFKILPRRPSGTAPSGRTAAHQFAHIHYSAAANPNAPSAPNRRGPALTESGKENGKPRGFPAYHASQRQAQRRRPPRREAGEKTRTKRSIQTSSMPRQRRGPRPQGRACGNRHPPTAKAPASTASPRRLCLKGRAAFQKLPPIAAYRNAFCRMLARSP